MINYLYDGSYYGFLCTVYHVEKSTAYPAGIHQNAVPYLSGLYQRMHKRIREKMGRETTRYIYYANLAGETNAPIWLYEYLLRGKALGLNLNKHIADNTVFRIHKLCQKVTGERHRLLGLIRFRLSNNGFYYSQISPDHRVLELMGQHFASRLANQCWIIHDTKRNLALIGQTGQYKIVPWHLDGNEYIEKDVIENAWQKYFKNIAIPERINPKCQANCMPRRYWDNLIEKPQEER